MATLLNVDPVKKDDIYYRYKMPSIEVKIEGSGNGIKTVFPNIADVCAKLNRPPELLNKFFGTELGALSNYVKEDNKFLIMGQFSAERIQEKVYAFITRLVLCKYCRSPETDITVQNPNSKRPRICFVCRSCGKLTIISPTERVYKHIAALADVFKKQQSMPRKNTTAEPVIPQTEPTEPAPVLPDVSLTNAPKKENPIDILHDFVSANPPPSEQRVAQRIHQLITDYNLKDEFMIRLAMQGILRDVGAGKMIGALQLHRGLFKHLIGIERSSVVFICEVVYACQKVDAAYRVPMMLKMFWEEGIVSEEAILKWHASRDKTRGIDKAFDVQTKHKSQRFIEWLSVNE